jgi:hypothetical protein
MGWEKRGNNSYYYRKKRVGHQAVSEYIGAGPFSDMVALLDEEERHQREYERQRWKEEKAANQAQINQVDDAIKLIRQITAAVCIASGCYQHKRQWRRYALSDTRGSDSE